MKIEDNLFTYFEKAGQVIHYKKDDIIFMQEDIAQNFYLITKGRVRVHELSSNGKDITYDILYKGRLFGESSFLNAYRPVTISAITDVTLISCHLEDLYPYLTQSKELTIALLQIMSDTCDHTTKLLRWYSTYNRYEKVAALLLDISKHDNIHQEIIDSNIPYTHQDIASSTGLARQTVSTALKQFVEDGFINTHYGKIKIIDKEGLYQKYLSSKE